MPRRTVHCLFTDRFASPRADRDPARPIGFGAADRYAEFNLGDHVGDDPARVAANRAQLAARLRPEGPPVLFMQQVHGTAVGTVDAHPGGPILDVDALVTTQVNLPLAVLVADCVPVLLHDPDGAAIAVVHAGRPGTKAGVVQATLGALELLGVRPARLVARLGPSIGGCCYEVPQAMQDEVALAVPNIRATTRWGTPSLDIRSGVIAQLLAGGVREISLDGRCTHESPELYSYRRDGITGRFAGVISISE